jgi:hypothetical protein
MRGTLDDPEIGGFIGTLPDRPLDCFRAVRPSVLGQ